MRDEKIDHYLKKIRIIDGEKFILNNVFLDGIKMDKLPFKDVHIKGHFSCTNCGLKSLEGSPKSVEYHFSCNDNDLETLEGISPKIGSNIYAVRSNLKSLKGINELGGSIYIDETLKDDDFFIELALQNKICIPKNFVLV